MFMGLDMLILSTRSVLLRGVLLIGAFPFRERSRPLSPAGRDLPVCLILKLVAWRIMNSTPPAFSHQTGGSMG
jgi:hypothetical protein